MVYNKVNVNSNFPAWWEPRPIYRGSSPLDRHSPRDRLRGKSEVEGSAKTLSPGEGIIIFSENLDKIASVLSLIYDDTVDCHHLSRSTYSLTTVISSNVKDFELGENEQKKCSNTHLLYSRWETGGWLEGSCRTCSERSCTVLSIFRARVEGNLQRRSLRRSLKRFCKIPAAGRKEIIVEDYTLKRNREKRIRATVKCYFVIF